MRKIQLITVILTLALAIPFVILALIEAVYLIDFVRNISSVLTGAVEWRSVAAEGSARWPELVIMIIGQIVLLSLLLFVRRRQPMSEADSWEDTLNEQADPSKHV
jgi:hypothetical protein